LRVLYMLQFSRPVQVFTTPEFDRWLTGLRDRLARSAVMARIDRLADGNPGDCRTLDNAMAEFHYLHNSDPGYASPGDPPSAPYPDAVAVSNTTTAAMVDVIIGIITSVALTATSASLPPEEPQSLCASGTSSPSTSSHHTWLKEQTQNYYSKTF